MILVVGFRSVLKLLRWLIIVVPPVATEAEDCGKTDVSELSRTVATGNSESLFKVLLTFDVATTSLAESGRSMDTLVGVACIVMLDTFSLLHSV